jgi:hypothetical protein
MPKILGWWVVAHEILVTAQTSMCLDRVLVKENQKEGETITQSILEPISMQVFEADAFDLINLSRQSFIQGELKGGRN